MYFLLFGKYFTQVMEYNRAAAEVVRPRVPLEACLASYSSPEEVMDFFSTALKAKTTATK